MSCVQLENLCVVLENVTGWEVEEVNIVEICFEN